MHGVLLTLEGAPHYEAQTKQRVSCSLFSVAVKPRTRTLSLSCAVQGGEEEHSVPSTTLHPAAVSDSPPGIKPLPLPLPYPITPPPPPPLVNHSSSKAPKPGTRTIITMRLLGGEKKKNLHSINPCFFRSVRLGVVLFIPRINCLSLLRHLLIFIWENMLPLDRRRRRHFKQMTKDHQPPHAPGGLITLPSLKRF